MGSAGASHRSQEHGAGAVSLTTGATPESKRPPGTPRRENAWFWHPRRARAAPPVCTNLPSFGVVRTQPTVDRAAKQAIFEARRHRAGVALALLPASD